MDIQPASAPQTAPVTSPARRDDDMISSDFHTFLTLLTTQLQNQDPLNPLESSEFAVQLATFSSVEQQVKTNDLLRDLAAGMGASGLSQLAGWVGMEARVAAPALFDGTPVTLVAEPDPASDAATLVVRDEAGREVLREAMPPTGGPLLWAGTRAGGDPLPAGLYTFEVESLNRGEVTGVRPVDHYARITEARQGPDGIELVIEGGATVPSAGVTALRRGDGPAL